MQHVFSEIEQALIYDPTRRGLCGNTGPARIDRLVAELTRARRVLVLTGFPVLACGIGETDGPNGAANLAYALLELGKQVVVVTDALSHGLLRAACRARGFEAAVEVVPRKGATAFCRALTERFRPTHIVAIERPGKGVDEHYYSMRGECIDGEIADTDALFDAPGAVKIAVGDGGNELGMGAFREQIERGVMHGDRICADRPADLPLVAAVSNWWSWGVVGALSAASGRRLLPSCEEETAMLRAVVDAGGVDGVTRRREPTVDGLSLDEYLSVLRQVQRIVALACGRADWPGWTEPDDTAQAAGLPENEETPVWKKL